MTTAPFSCLWFAANGQIVAQAGLSQCMQRRGTKRVFGTPSTSTSAR